MLQYNLFYFMIDKRIKYLNFQEIELIIYNRWYPKQWNLRDELNNLGFRRITGMIARELNGFRIYNIILIK